MVISDEYRFIFVAVPKTATTSIENVLKLYGRIAKEADSEKHVKAVELRETLDPETWRNYFKFAFVRHPLDWTRSWYSYRARSGLLRPNHPQHSRSTAHMSFEEFLESDPLLTGDERQCNFIMDDEDNLLVDYVGKYETLNADFGEVCRIIGIPQTKLPVRNRSPDQDYSYLYNERTKAMVLKAHERELRVLGYSPDYQYKPVRRQSLIRKARVAIARVAKELVIRKASKS